MTIMNDLKFARTVSAAFTGHRFYDFSQREFIQERLTSAISEAYDHGIRNFISGFALGIDLMAAQLVQSLKCNLPGISLTAAIPLKATQRDIISMIKEFIDGCLNWLIR